jgi:hypothetical protein
VTGARARGVVLYALAAVLLLAGTLWYVAAAPPDPPVSTARLASWQRAAGRMLPDRPLQVAAQTLVLGEGSATQRTEPVTGGSYTLSMICLGERGAVRVRLSATGYDSGRAVPCAESPTVVSVTVGLADQFLMRADGETSRGPAVFRWRLERAGGF